jgi:succinyldiaminopimelate transaminase
VTPSDLLAQIRRTASLSGVSVVDLGLGTPVDPTPDIVQDALRAAADAPGYPTTAGRDELRAACSRWLDRILGAHVEPDAILPTIGSKELVAALPRLLGLPAGSRIAIPLVAYPTYAVGAILAGCEPIATDEPESVEGAALVWLNSPGNPTGGVLKAARMAEIVAWARETGAVVVNDECYVELGWEAEPVSILHPSVCGGSHEGVLAVHSLSKRSNLAGYRFGSVAGDPLLVARLLAVRKHLGLMVPTPVQSAAIAALDDDDHVTEQRRRYEGRRRVLRRALATAGLRVDDSRAGLYLWATRGEPCWDTVRWFAGRGIVVSPGDFYGASGSAHVRLALTASDADIATAAERLARP